MDKENYYESESIPEDEEGQIAWLADEIEKSLLILMCPCDPPQQEGGFDTDTKHRLPHYRKGRWG